MPASASLDVDVYKSGDDNDVEEETTVLDDDSDTEDALADVVGLHAVLASATLTGNTPVDLSPLPALRDHIRGQVDAVIRIRDRIAYPPNQAYLEAMYHDAKLVQTETDPLQFVRYCHYDLWAGAERLCLDRTRKSLMTATGLFTVDNYGHRCLDRR